MASLSLLLRTVLITTITITTASTTQAATPTLAPCPAIDCINLPADAGMLNVKDFGAYGDGIHDDTAAINAALTASGGDTGTKFWQSRMVYLPIGTYLVSSPVVKRFSDGSYGSGFQLVGQSRQATIIKLMDQAADYQDTANPRAVLFTSSKLLAGTSTLTDGRDYLNLGEGNDAYANFVENLTVDVGAGNSGAIGIDYLANNHGAIRRVTLRAASDSGSIGVSMQRKWPGPAFLQDVTVQGFETGIAVNQTEYGLTMERITLNNQRLNGLYNNHNMLSVRVLRINEVPNPIINASDDGLITLIGANIVTSRTDAIEAIQNKGSMNIRSLGMRGYSSLMGAPPKTYLGGAYVLEGVFQGNIRTANSYQSWSLPLSDPPAAPNTAITKWVSVTSYGADSNGTTSSTTAIRNALASGADTIYFPFGTYLVDDNIIIPNTVRRIVGMNSTLTAQTTRLASFSRDLGLLRTTNNTNPLIVEHLMLDHSDLGDQVLMEVGGTQPLVLRDVVTAGAGTPLWRPSTGGKLYVENLSAGKILLEGKQGTWMRQVNTEGAGTRITNRGAPLWILGVKTEGNCTVIENSAGGKTEMLGGLVYLVSPNLDPTIPAFRNIDGQMLTSYIEESFSADSAYAIHMQSTINGVTKNVMADSLMPRKTGRLVAQLSSTSLPKDAVTVPIEAATPVVAQGQIFGDNFGINIKTEKITKPELDLIASLAIKRVRISIPWYHVESVMNKYTWSNQIGRDSQADDYAVSPSFDFDSMIASIRDRKLHLDITLHEGNAMRTGLVNIAAAGQPAEWRHAAPRTPDQMAAFAAFAGATAQHYEGIYGHNAFTWHIWNEPDTTGSFAPQVDSGVFGKLMSLSCEAIRKYVPTAAVMGGALSARGDGDLPYDFLDGMFKSANPLTCVDGITIHPYRAYVPETAAADFATAAQHLAPFQPANKPIVPVASDEWGYSISKTAGEIPFYQRWRDFSGEEQAALMFRIYLTNLTANVPLTVIYDWRDNGTDPYNWEDHFGVVGYKMEEKPALKMFRAVWPLLAGRALQIANPQPPSCSSHEHILRFGSKSTDSSAWSVVWTDDTTTHAMQIQGQVTQIMDIFGNNVALAKAGLNEKITLNGAPLLVRHALNPLPIFTCSTQLAAAQ